MQKLYLDIETLPADESCFGVLKSIHEKRCRKRKTHQDFERFYLSTSLDGSFGRILCVAYASNDQDAAVIYDEEDETVMLARFWEIAYDHELFIGHNIMDFDLRFIYQRSIILGVEPTKKYLSFARYRNDPIYDTMYEWSKWNMQSKISLDVLAKALGFPSSKGGEVEGKNVAQAYLDGKIDKICYYCEQDVELTRKIYKRMIFES